MDKKHLSILESLDMRLHGDRSLAEIGLSSEAELVQKLRELNALLLELIEELAYERKANESRQ